jgi:hypothetical protein
MKKLTLNEFIEKSNNIHKYKYDYSQVKYKKNNIKVKIICNKHGIFEQTPSAHINNNQGCPKCANLLKSQLMLSSDNEFIEKAKNIHKNKYNYSQIKYINSHKKINIICNKHGVFEQLPYNHLNGKGCPICNTSKGENNISEILDRYNIKYETQKTFKDCKYKYVLRFDFYLPDYNICIEYNGIQHYKPIKYFGGIKKYNVNEERFKIKENFCNNNNIKLIIIKYNDNIINLLKHLNIDNNKTLS